MCVKYAKHQGDMLISWRKNALFSFACFSHICGPVHLGGFIFWAPSFCGKDKTTLMRCPPHKPAITSISFGLNIHPEKKFTKKIPKMMGFWNKYHLSNHESWLFGGIYMSSFKGFFSNSHNHGSVENGPLSPRWSFFLEISRKFSTEILGERGTCLGDGAPKTKPAKILKNGGLQDGTFPFAAQTIFSGLCRLWEKGYPPGD